MALNVIGDDGKPLELKFYKTRSQRIAPVRLTMSPTTLIKVYVRMRDK